MSKSCTVCGKRAYSDYCVQHKPRKPIAKKGKKAKAYEKWRDEVAIPYLDNTTGRVCADCGGVRCGNKQLDVDHILKRSTHPHLVFDFNNIQYLGRYPCHAEKDGGVDIKL